LFGLLFPTEIDPNATKAPAPPAVTMLSPMLPLIVIGTNGPINGYGVRYGNSIAFAQGGGAGMTCSTGPNGVGTCSNMLVAPGKGMVYNQSQPTGTTIPSGLFSGWQYWQATVTMQLVICLVALILSAVLLPPIRHLPWRRRARAGA
jgi:hypothetical protein